MRSRTLQQLDQMFREWPNMRADSTPTDQEVENASTTLESPFPDDYREFLCRYGSAMVGAYPVFGLRPCALLGTERWSVVDLTQEWRRLNIEGTQGWIIVSEDHAGNAIGIDSGNSVQIMDHDFGGITKLADSFEHYVSEHCLARL